VTVYLVRHAKAGSRRNWSGPDEKRPVSKPGQRQADAIADALRHEPITRVVTSPYVRCIQTVKPLAKKLDLGVDTSEALTEGAPVSEAAALLDKLAREDAVLCSHGDVIGDLLMLLADRGVRFDDFRLEKGSTWVLACEDGRVTSARYVPPPA
jgi:broad specificity phosphatase PhoE